MDRQRIINALQQNRVLITDHADEEADADGLKIDEIYFSVEHGEIIETYIEDKPYPSCLIYGLTFSGGTRFIVYGLIMLKASGRF